MTGSSTLLVAKISKRGPERITCVSPSSLVR